ncbi:MAG: hypothetical protein D8M57_02885 [Candidatus Scalindua sp. AMX11]|nr:MAG: hypothetical protein DWQ00_17105 [Candidatus Scalindua sp.]TDE66371.1 MAG: hypothetical protein D8M57_02885 [Candidatus Scalindua sp. AMX11]
MVFNLITRYTSSSQIRTTFFNSPFDSSLGETRSRLPLFLEPKFFLIRSDFLISRISLDTKKHFSILLLILIEIKKRELFKNGKDRGGIFFTKCGKKCHRSIGSSSSFRNGILSGTNEDLANYRLGRLL